MRICGRRSAPPTRPERPAPAAVLAEPEDPELAVTQDVIDQDLTALADAVGTCLHDVE